MTLFSTVHGWTHPPDEADLLAREPAVLTGALIGCARVSTADQIIDRQTRALAEVGCLRVFAEKRTGRTAERPEPPPRRQAGEVLAQPLLPGAGECLALLDGHHRDQRYRRTERKVLATHHGARARRALPGAPPLPRRRIAQRHGLPCYRRVPRGRVRAPRETS
jgi:hypothetical protein